MNKICPHCGKSLECKENDVLNCHCASIGLSNDVRRTIADRYDDCLCAECLKAFGNKTIQE